MTHPMIEAFRRLNATPVGPPRYRCEAAREAAKEIERVDLDQQDDGAREYNDWTPAYRDHITAIIDRMIRIYGVR
jgi:hypothetical protein